MARESRNLETGNTVSSPYESAEWIAELMQSFTNSVFRASMPDVMTFFNMLAQVSHDIFAAKMVRIWDNNVHTGALVLQASYPFCDLDRTFYTISREGSLTGLAIEYCDIKYTPNIHKQVDKRK